MIDRARERKCKSCLGKFRPCSTSHIVCSPKCAIDHARNQQERRLRKERQARRRLTREQLMTRRDWIKKVQVAFNRYVRLRDREKPCICCGRPLGVQRHGSTYDAGHYRSVGSTPYLRFNEDNCHAQLKVCNRFGAGRPVDYRIGLIARIGLERVEALEAEQTQRKYTIDELKEIHSRYTRLASEIARGSCNGSSERQGTAHV